MRRLTVLLALLTLLGCQANATRTRHLHVGMTKADVVTAIGTPTSMGADKQSEVLYYRLMEGTFGGEVRTYFVRLIDGKVDSFGRINELQLPSSVESLPPPPTASQ